MHVKDVCFKAWWDYWLVNKNTIIPTYPFMNKLYVIHIIIYVQNIE